MESLIERIIAIFWLDVDVVRLVDIDIQMNIWVLATEDVPIWAVVEFADFGHNLGCVRST